jgi:hypothetical protein
MMGGRQNLLKNSAPLHLKEEISNVKFNILFHFTYKIALELLRQP